MDATPLRSRTPPPPPSCSSTTIITTPTPLLRIRSPRPHTTFRAPYSPVAVPSVTYVNQYFVVPPYTPIMPVAAYYGPPLTGWGSVGTFPPIVPRFDTGPKEAKIEESLMTRSDAVLLVDGAKTGADGLRRFFTSPPLEAGTYAYQVTASWMREGQEIRMDRTVEVSPGGHYSRRFQQDRAGLDRLGSGLSFSRKVHGALTRSRSQFISRRLLPLFLDLDENVSEGTVSFNGLDDRAKCGFNLFSAIRRAG